MNHKKESELENTLFSQYQLLLLEKIDQQKAEKFLKSWSYNLYIL